MNTVQGGTGGYSNSSKKGNIDLWEVRIFSNDILIRGWLPNYGRIGKNNCLIKRFTNKKAMQQVAIYCVRL